MEKLLALSANVIIGYSAYEMYNYYTIKQLEHKIKPATMIDMSFESIPEELIGKSALIGTSVSELKNGLANFTLTHNVEEKGVRDNIIKV
jgi:hypothetical protein